MKIIGMMSGTSLDGVDAALLEFDEKGVVARLATHFEPYKPNERAALLENIGTWEASSEALSAIHDAHNRALSKMPQADIVGFHGQTLNHDPKNGRTFQAGDPNALKTNAKIIYDFRTQDVEAGGEGAPLIPIYHYALAHELEFLNPVLFVNIGGVSNVTYVDPSLPPEKGLLAFDTGPGNAMSDDLMKYFYGQDFDEDGALAKKGAADQRWLDLAFQYDFFQKSPPKSLDRLSLYKDFEALKQMRPEDALATAMAFTSGSIKRAMDYLPRSVSEILLCGGGRKNAYLKEALQGKNIDEYGLDGDMIEAEGFAYLAWLRLQERPASFPKTTGVNAPMMAGQIWNE